MGNTKALAFMTPISIMLQQPSTWVSRPWLCEHQPESPAHSDPRLPQQRLFSLRDKVWGAGFVMCYLQRKALLLTGKRDFFCLTLNH